jgi:hypothetical protein
MGLLAAIGSAIIWAGIIFLGMCVDFFNHPMDWLSALAGPILFAVAAGGIAHLLWGGKRN